MKQPTMNEMVKDKELVNEEVCRMIYAEGLPFNLVKSQYFKKALEAVANYGRGYNPPSYHEARVTYLQREVDKINNVNLDKYRKEWKKTGCTLMSDGWTDGKSRSITNFLVNNPSGTVFLKSVDTSSIAKSEKKLWELLDSMIQEVGPEN